MDNQDRKWISGFWKRVFALVIDSLILGAVGFGLGLAFESQFAAMGAWGRGVGFVIALSYFGLLNSHVGKGQTLGKRLLSIRVVNAAGRCISVPRSFGRYTVFALPFLFNGVHFTSEAYLSILIYPLSMIIFGGFFSIIYLYLFNRNSRQTLHDLAVGTYVVNADAAVENTKPVWNVHIMVTAAIFLVAAAIPVFTTGLIDSQPFKNLLASQQALSEVPGVHYATVSSGETILSSTDADTQSMTYISAQVFVDKQHVEDDALARQLADVITQNYPDYKTKNVIQIVLTYGFDIGIWSQWKNYTYTFNPTELSLSE